MKIHHDINKKTSGLRYKKTQVSTQKSPISNEKTPRFHKRRRILRK
jgi:hypothetical protein